MIQSKKILSNLMVITKEDTIRKVFESLHKSPLTPSRDLPKKLETFGKYSMYEASNTLRMNIQGVNLYARFPLT